VHELLEALPKAGPLIERVLDESLAELQEDSLMARRSATSARDAGSSPRFTTLWRKPSGMTPLMNPKPPALPSGVISSLEEYYAACGAIGLLSSQAEAPDPDEAIEWSLDFGERMAREARKRWRGSRAR
jgi:hypothetical protein